VFLLHQRSLLFSSASPFLAIPIFKRDLSLPYLLADSAIGLPITNLSLNGAKVRGQLS